jgi:hypothetical protein
MHKEATDREAMDREAMDREAMDRAEEVLQRQHPAPKLVPVFWA